MSPSAAIGIPPRMYKHFAAITLAVTFLVALFAEGDKARDAAAPLEQEIAGQEDQMQSAVRAKLGRVPIAGGVSGAMRDYGGGDFGPDVAFGEPMEAPTNSGGYIPTGAAPAYELSEEFLATLSEAERAALMAGWRNSGMTDPLTRERQIAALNSASARRSGSAPGVH